MGGCRTGGSQAAAVAVTGDHVLLSPGFSSLDQFAGYAARGDHFENLVNTLAAETANV